MLVCTQNFLSQTVSISLHTAVIRQRKEHILKVTKKGSGKLQSKETQTNTFSSADLLRLASVLLSASQTKGEISVPSDSERVLKITDRIQVSGVLEKLSESRPRALLVPLCEHSSVPFGSCPLWQSRGRTRGDPRGPARAGLAPTPGPGRPGCSPKARSLLSPVTRTRPG